MTLGGYDFVSVDLCILIPLGYEFVSVDLGALTVRIKHMSIIDYATAKILSQEAFEDTGNIKPKPIERLYRGPTYVKSPKSNAWPTCKVWAGIGCWS